MGRQRTIDRDKVLDAAENIVLNQGAAALTIDAVAKSMGISKGGVQYCFGNKDALIDAMFERWGYTCKYLTVRLKKTAPQKIVLMPIGLQPMNMTKSRWRRGQH